MKQVVQNFRDGRIQVADVPSPGLRDGGALIRTTASVVSAGTERMVLDFAQRNLLQKAIARPDLVRQVLDKVKRDGLAAALSAVRGRLQTWLPLGYSSAGVVVAAGRDLSGVAPGTRVACAGGGYAAHAELVFVPRNLLVPIPEGVGDEEAAFATLAAVSLHGLRLADARLGESVAVIGLGLLGQIAAQLTTAAGCRVVGIDLDPQRVALARRLGAGHTAERRDAAAAVEAFTGGRGADAVLITADARDDDPAVLAGAIARDRARVVAVGAFDCHLPRKVYYEKELSFVVSRSYGPGRYDAQYEDGGVDYPYTYVRWTEQRNIEAALRLMADGKLDVRSLITHRVPIEQAQRAYHVITGQAGEPSLGVVLSYQQARTLPGRIAVSPAAPAVARGRSDGIAIGVVGAGLFANAVALPVLRRLPGVRLAAVVSASGLSARQAAERYGFGYCASSFEELLADPAIDALAIFTRHHLHADQLVAGLGAGKHVFVEKPLAITQHQLSAAAAAIRDAAPRGLRAMVGFNRRFSPLAVAARRFLAQRHGPLVMQYRVNAGAIPPEHWTRDPAVGGGRLIGECCHFIDLLRFLAGSPIIRVHALGRQDAVADDDLVITLDFADGSLGTIAYAARGDRSVGKERLEILGAGRTVVLDDFRRLDLVADGRRRTLRHRWSADKGHRSLWQAFAAGLRNPPTPLGLDLGEMVETTLTTLRAVEALALGQPLPVTTEEYLAALAPQS